MLSILPLVLVIASAPSQHRPDLEARRTAEYALSAKGVGSYQYLSPVPGSRLVSPLNTIAIRQGSILDPGTIDARGISVTGSASGLHVGRLVLSDDQRTLVFEPDQPFAPGEAVRVHLDPGAKTAGGADLPVLDFGFEVSVTDPRRARSAVPEEADPETPAPPAGADSPAVPPELLALASTPCDTLPPNYPGIILLTSSDPDSGVTFMTAGSSNGRLFVMDNAGVPLYYRYFKNRGPAHNFTRQPNGLLTYFLTPSSKFYGMDSTYAVVDSFMTGNGYVTDLHELQLLSNGHALLMSYDPEPVDMSSIVPGGNPAATVTGLIIQEIDAGKNVVFQWRSWDHYAITDCVSPAVLLTGVSIDYVHGNALEEDDDGNILLSARHMDEITKIDRQTGAIIWRFGPHAVNNQFTVVNDPQGFSHQHDIRRLPNGNITLFDNGNYIAPNYSRGVEYQLDETSMIASEVWEYRNTPDSYGPAQGSLQRRAGAGTMISWGRTTTDPILTDLHADGSKAFELGYGTSTRMSSYRALRYPWRTTRFATDTDSLLFAPVQVGDAASLPLMVRNTSSSNVTISCIASTDSEFTVTGWAPVTLSPGDSASVTVNFAPTAIGQHAARLYVRQVVDSELVAQVVGLRGSGVELVAVPGSSVERFGLSVIGPNPFGVATMLGISLPKSGRVRLEVLDVQGRRVETLVDEVRAAGSYQVPWRAWNRPDGMYFCRLRAVGQLARRKLLLMR